MKKIVVMINYFEREFQLRRTLKSISKTKHTNFEVVIMDNMSKQGITHIAQEFPNLKITFFNKEKNPENWHSMIVSHNEVVLWILENLEMDIFIHQDAECYHIGDVLMYANDNLTDENYFSFATFSTDEATAMKPDFEETIEQIARENTTEAAGNGVLAWYNHPIYRAVGYWFCVAMTRKNVIALNGIDQRFAEGVCYADNDIVRRIRNLGLDLKIPTESFVVHQWHYENKYGTDHINYDHMAINQKIWEHIATTEPTNYKAHHLTTPDFH